MERILSKIRVAAVTNFKDVPSVLIDKLLANVPENIKCLLPEIGLLRTLVYRTRRSSGAALMGHMANTQLHEELFAENPEAESNLAVASTSAEAELEEEEEDEEEQGKEIFPIPKCGARKL